MPKTKTPNKAISKRKGKTSSKLATKKTSAKTPAKTRSKKTTSNAIQLFSFLKGKAKPKKNFSTNFNYGNLSVDINSAVKGKMVSFNIKIYSENFNAVGVVSINADAFENVQEMFDHIRSNF